MFLKKINPERKCFFWRWKVNWWKTYQCKTNFVKWSHHSTNVHASSAIRNISPFSLNAVYHVQVWLWASSLLWEWQHHQSRCKRLYTLPVLQNVSHSTFYFSQHRLLTHLVGCTCEKVILVVKLQASLLVCWGTCPDIANQS